MIDRLWFCFSSRSYENLQHEEGTTLFSLKNITNQKMLSDRFPQVKQFVAINVFRGLKFVS